MTLAALTGGCAAVAPTLTSLVANFAQDLIAAASANHSPRYAVQVEELLIALASQATGMELQAQLAQSGYRPPPPDYLQGNAPGYYYSGTPQQPNNPYLAATTPYVPDGGGYGRTGLSDPAAGYGQGGAYDPAYGEAAREPGAYGDAAGYEQPYDPAYEQGAYGEGAGYEQPYDPAYGQGAYDQGAYGEAADYGQPYDPAYEQGTAYDRNSGQGRAQGPGHDGAARRQRAPGGARARYRSAGHATLSPITLEADVLARRRDSSELKAIEDGATLHDGGDNPTDGDLLKLRFRANCACHVYVVGVDATGYVARIYPDPEEDHRNPVTPGVHYLVPAGDSDWWAMDAFKGVEHVFFVASYLPRPDIARLLDVLGDSPRDVDPGSFQPVNAAAIVPATRGLVKVSTSPATSAEPRAAAEAAVFTSEQPGNELVVTRWFHHR